MTSDGPSDGPLSDALLAAQLLLLAPEVLGGIALRGAGPARDWLTLQLQELAAERPWRRMPGHIEDERLLGGIDLAASLASGTPVRQTGLLDEVQTGFLCVPMAERLREDLAGKLVQAMDGMERAKAFALVLLDDGREIDERPAASLTDRIAFICDLSGVAPFTDLLWPDHDKTISISSVAPASPEQCEALAQTAAALGIDDIRALLFAVNAAKAHAALYSRKIIADEDLAAAARLVLAPRAVQLPMDTPLEEAAEPPSETQQTDHSENQAENSKSHDAPLEEVVLEAALASIPEDVLAAIAEGRIRKSTASGGTGKRTQSKLRGRPLGARPGVPRGGARLALIDSLRAAAPWQTIRRQNEPDAQRSVLMRKDDLRVRRFEERAGSVTVFCVDASGSAAAARLAEAKGAVELILAQAYVKRSEVALIAFRGEGAEVLLPPTRSLTRARRALAGLPGGGGTPLASGMTLGLQIAESVSARGRTPFLVFLTDGSANIALDGSPGRAQAREDAQAAAKTIARAGIETILIDISPRPRPDAADFAEAMLARYLPLPMADAVALEKAVSAAQPQLAPA